MKFDSFSIHATLFITDAYCTNRKCRGSLREVSNGWLSRAMFCPKCEAVYMLRLIKVIDHKVSPEFVTQARKESSVSNESESNTASFSKKP